MILHEEGFLPMSGLNGLLMPRFQMSTHIAGIQRESLFMTTLIGLDGARRGLTRSQKRRVQRLRQTKALEEEERKEVPRKRVRSEVCHVKPKADEGQQSRSSAVPINMVFMLPSEFMAPDDDDKEQD